MLTKSLILLIVIAAFIAGTLVQARRESRYWAVIERNQLKEDLAKCIAAGYSADLSEPPWIVTIPTKKHDGTSVTIQVFPWPLENDGYVVNFIDPNRKPDGRCWGTTIYPQPID
jgi:hypothetical protein